MFDRDDAIWAAYGEALEQYLGRFDELISQFDTHADMLDSYMNIWQKSGKAFKDPTTSLKLLGAQADNAGAKVEGLKQKFDFAAEESRRMTEQYNS
jgi:hypothetical protein